MKKTVEFITKCFFLNFVIASVITLILPINVNAYDVPELIYYKFNNTSGITVQNEASSPVGTNPATVNNLTIGGIGEFGSALIGNGGSSSTNYVDTGWVTNLGSGGWTIGLWLNNIPNDTTLYYIFGDNSATSFRCFIGGVAGAGNIIIRGGGLSDLIVSGIASAQPSVVHFVYDPAASEIRGYLNGLLNNTVSDSAVNITGTTGPFKVGGYSASLGIPNGALLDEFRVYSRALPAQEIAETWNTELPTTPVLQNIPTLSEWGIMIMATILLLMGIRFLKKNEYQ